MDLRKDNKFTARGLRNNNPFNLQKTSIQWQGKTTGNDSRFETFLTVQQGIRAGVIDIVGDIAKDGLNTLSKLFESFAPRHENDTTAYINFVSKAANVAPGALLTTNGKIDPATLAKIVTAIIQKENGIQQANLLPASVIQEGIQMAINSPAIKRYILPAPTKTNPAAGKLLDASLIFIFIFLLIYLIK